MEPEGERSSTEIGSKSPIEPNSELNNTSNEDITQEEPMRRYSFRERKEINYGDISSSDLDPYHVIILVIKA
ncbi:13809_t:CDS:2 [Acaulospora morrowiae]|uniref:13809_t:CDS:1 n=1 Tax=Acaulospora morrowiae TaxID=94023 RepID=A0A9N9A5X4_9GLOM|nr:13809_t:CDS:2 [Acaulospora morrowiae]